MKLPDPLFRLLLKFLRAGGKVRIFVAEQLVGNLTGEKYPKIRMLMDIFANQIHADRCADRRDVIGAQQLHHMREGLQHILFRDNDLGMIGTDIVCHFFGVFQVNGIDIHTDGEGFDGLFELLRRHGADQTGIQTTGQQETYRRVRVKALFNPRGQLFPDVPAGGFQIVMAHPIGPADIPVTDKFSVPVVMSRGKGHNFLAQSNKVLCFAGENDLSVRQIPIVKRTDADGIPGGNKFFPVIQNERKLRVQLFKHVYTVFFIQRKQQLAVGFSRETIPLLLQGFLDLPETVYFSIADNGPAAPDKGLHTPFIQSHNGQPVKSQKTRIQREHPGHIRPP